MDEKLLQGVWFEEVRPLSVCPPVDIFDKGLTNNRSIVFSSATVNHLSLQVNLHSDMHVNVHLNICVYVRML